MVPLDAYHPLKADDLTKSDWYNYLGSEWNCLAAAMHGEAQAFHLEDLERSLSR